MAIGERRRVRQRGPEVSFEYRPGPHPRMPADEFYAHVERLRVAHGGIVTPAALVEEARAEGSPLHDSCLFVWDDRLAAHEQRLDHAARLLRCVIRVEAPPELPEPTRYVALVRVREADGRRGYVPSARLLDDADLLRQAGAEAEKLLRGVINHYRNVPGLWDTLRETIERLVEE
jgi:hypothetical protein